MVYSISEGLIVLIGCILKSGCFFDSLCKTDCAGVNCCGFIGKSDYFSVINLDLWSCLLNLLTLFNFASVNLSDFSHSTLISLTYSLEVLSLSKV